MGKKKDKKNKAHKGKCELLKNFEGTGIVRKGQRTTCAYRHIAADMCSVIAVSQALGMSYFDAYMEMAKVGCEFNLAMNHIFVIGYVLEHHGFESRYASEIKKG